MLHDMRRPVGDVLAIVGIVPTMILMVPFLLVVVALVGLWAVFHHMDNRLLCSCIMVDEGGSGARCGLFRGCLDVYWCVGNDC